MPNHKFIVAIIAICFQSVKAFIFPWDLRRNIHNGVILHEEKERGMFLLSVQKLAPTDRKPDLRHSDIVWKIRPSENTSKLDKMKWIASANLLRLNYQRKNEKVPFIILPPGEQMLLEAWYEGEKIGRFGITCQKGPSFPPIEETIREIYDVATAGGIGIAAVIYMFIEPEFRGRSIGKLALDIIAYIHASIGADFTVLVADDKSENETLVNWYEHRGYSRAPKLQDFMGSPGGNFGITMIGPTRAEAPASCQIEWW